MKHINTYKQRAVYARQPWLVAKILKEGGAKYNQAGGMEVSNYFPPLIAGLYELAAPCIQAHTHTYKVVLCMYIVI